MATNSTGQRAWRRKHDPVYRERELKRDREAKAIKLATDPTYKQKLQALRTKYKTEYPEMGLYHAAKHRAKKRNVPFDLQITDIVIPSTCPVLGLQLVRGCGKLHDASPTIDRIDPAKGYIKDNIMIISYKANRIKNNGTAGDVMRVALWMKDTGSGI